MVARGEAGHGLDSLTKGLPHLRDELGTTVRHNVLGNSMQANDIEGEEVCSLCSRRKLGERNNVDCLREPVNHSQDGVIALGYRQPCNKVHTYVGPWPIGDWERL